MFKNKIFWPKIILVVIPALFVILLWIIMYLVKDTTITNTLPQTFSVSRSIESVKGEIKTGKFEINHEEMASVEKLVNQGDQSWRLNPATVVLNEMTKYGFDNQDYETLINISSVDDQKKIGTETTKVQMELIHKEKVYIVTLIKPIFKKEQLKIWTISEIRGKDKISDWQIYRNEEYGFEFEYPQDFYFSQGSYSEEYRKHWIEFVDLRWKDQMIHNPSLIVDIIQTDLSLKEYLKKTSSLKSILSDSEPCVNFLYCSVNTINDGIVGKENIPTLLFDSYSVSGSDSHSVVKNDGYIIDIRAHNSENGNFSDSVYKQILASFRFIEINENIIDNLSNLITENKVDSETGVKVEITSPAIMERNKENDVKLLISDWDKFGLNLLQSSLSVQNITDYRLSDKADSNCKESSGQKECSISIIPRCDWPNDIILYPIIRIFTKDPDHIASPFSNIKVNLSTPNMEICNNQIDDNCDGKIDGLDLQCTSFTVVVLPGEGITNLARRVISQYIEKFYSSSYLNEEQKIYAEDFIKKELKNKIDTLKSGQKIDFSVSLIEEAVSEARKLSTAQTNNLNQYTERINYSAYKFVSKSESVKNADSVWKIDDNTKNELKKVFRFKEDKSESWKVAEDSGSVTVYYENININKIFYLIGLYRQNIDAQDFSFRESLLAHSIQFSNNGINWKKSTVVYNNKNDKDNSSSNNNGAGVGNFYINVKDYNTGRLYIKFNLNSQGSGTGITLTKGLKTNLDL